MSKSKSPARRAMSALSTVSRSKIFLRLLLSIIALVMAVFLIGQYYRFSHRNDPVNIGISFSEKYASDLGLDPDQTLDYLIDDLGFRRFRLVSYWNEIEPQDNQWQFDRLDQQISKIESVGGEVILAIGQRQPRYPECHIPDWVSDSTRSDQLLEMLQIVTEKYTDNDVVREFLLENEASNRLFGECPEFDPGLLQSEFDLVKSITNKQVVINASNTIGIPLRDPIGDKVGFSHYGHFHYQGVASQYWWVPDWWHGFRAQMVQWIHGRSAFIHEMQGEPWGPGWIGDLSTGDQDKYFSADDLTDYVESAQGTGMHEIYLWGGEYWYYRQVDRGDDSFTNAARKVQQ